jgi:hypothetical protein
MQASLADEPSIAISIQDGLSLHSGAGEAISRRLKESPFAAVRCLDSNFHEGILTLIGRVPTYYTKQIAISLACNLPGVDLVVDRIEVHRQA